MRLTPDEIRTIKEAAAEAFGPTAVVRLFGSRLRDDVRGGDIDLHVELPQGEPGSCERGRFIELLWRGIGEREIDVLFSGPGQAQSSVDRKAREQGVIL